MRTRQPPGLYVLFFTEMWERFGFYTMVGHLYPEGSPLKDRAYNIFYMGINVGALLGPLVAEFMVQHAGYRPAFLMASLGMVVSVNTLWWFKRHVEGNGAPVRANPV